MRFDAFQVSGSHILTLSKRTPERTPERSANAHPRTLSNGLGRARVHTKPDLFIDDAAFVAVALL